MTLSSKLKQIGIVRQHQRTNLVILSGIAPQVFSPCSVHSPHLQHHCLEGPAHQSAEIKANSKFRLYIREHFSST